MEKIAIVYSNNGTLSEVPIKSALNPIIKSAFWYEVQKNGKPVGLKVDGIFIPFATEKMSWHCAHQQIGASMVNGTEILLALTEDLREVFDFCAERLGYLPLGKIKIPLASYPESCNLHPIHRKRYAPFFYPSQMCDVYTERFLPQEVRLAHRM